MTRLAACVATLGVCFWLAPASLAQEDSIQVELDAYWADVVRSVVEWDMEAQKATYHPDAIAIEGGSSSYSTRLMAVLFESVEADPDARPPVNPGLEFRFSSRVHDADSAHEVGMYHFWADGQEDFFGTVEAYLVKKDGRWMNLVEIRRGEGGRPRAEWDALATGAHITAEDEVRASVVAVLDSLSAAAVAKDLDAFMALWEQSDTVLYTRHGRTFVGWDEIRAEHARAFSAAEFGAERGAVHARSLGPDAGVGTSFVKLISPSESNWFIITATVEATEGEWRIVQAHASYPPPGTTPLGELER